MTAYDDITTDNDASLSVPSRPRHAHPKGQPRRSWAPADGVVSGVLPVLDVPAPVLSGMETLAVRNRMSDDLFIDTSDALGLSAAVEHLAPRLPRAVRETSRFVAAVVKNIVRVGLVIGTPLAVLGVLYGLGV